MFGLQYAITIYNGRKRWQAPADVFDLIEPVRGWLTRFQPRLQSKSLKEATMMYAGVEELKERAHREGRAEGSATVVCRQAELKFGPQVAERLSKLLEGLSDPERIARIGDRIFECETGAEFLARAREV